MPAETGCVGSAAEVVDIMKRIECGPVCGAAFCVLAVGCRFLWLRMFRLAGIFTKGIYAIKHQCEGRSDMNPKSIDWIPASVAHIYPITGRYHDKAANL